ncbi:hypothetical protein [Leptospira interrogans]|nr:hypothetical protein [Leptospira interrogans]
MQSANYIAKRQSGRRVAAIFADKESMSYIQNTKTTDMVVAISVRE